MTKDTQVRQDAIAPNGFKLRHGIIRAAIINKNDFSPGQTAKDSGNFLTQGPDVRSLVQYCRNDGDNGTSIRPIT
ncbi:hypothetical protein AA16373_1823 [Komagataeibacter swingsii DSM 16373]|nr:hypothetical protein AA16373_1823 [Komagataeibacter swingsii DSM 16373]